MEVKTGELLISITRSVCIIKSRIKKLFMLQNCKQYPEKAKRNLQSQEGSTSLQDPGLLLPWQITILLEVKVKLVSQKKVQFLPKSICPFPQLDPPFIGFACIHKIAEKQL